jgi:RloB-like protein
VARYVRQQRTTVLIACEGDAEEIFLKHIRRAYLNRGGNMALTIRNAHGKEAEHVLNRALAWQRAYGYDKVAIAYDTDKDLSVAQRCRAEAKGVVLLPSSPCFEASLLQLLGHPPPPSTAECKALFKQTMGCPAHDPRMVEHAAFARPNLDRLRERVHPVGRLLSFLEHPVTSNVDA